MSRRRFALAVIVAAAAGAAPVHETAAQPATPSARIEKPAASETSRQRARMQTAFMRAKLGLTDRETARVAAINLDYASRADPILSGSAAPTVKRRQLRALVESKEKELQAVLSPQQLQTYLAAREEMRDRLEEAIDRRLQPDGR